MFANNKRAGGRAGKMTTIRLILGCVLVAKTRGDLEENALARFSFDIAQKRLGLIYLHVRSNEEKADGKGGKHVSYFAPYFIYIFFFFLLL